MRKPVDAIEMVLEKWPSETRQGFVLVLPAAHNGPTGFARVYSGFDKPAAWEGGIRVLSAQVEQPERWHVFNSYTEAYEAAQWVGATLAHQDSRELEIAEVEIRVPVKLLSRRPVCILEGLTDV